MSTTPTYSVAPNPFDFGRLKIGQASAPENFTITNTSPIIDLTLDNCIIFNLTGGGQVIVGCGQGAANGTVVPLPAGFDVSRLAMFVTPGTGAGGDQLEGVFASGHTLGVFNTQWQTRAGSASGNPATSNYVFVAWTLGAAVTLNTITGSVGPILQVMFTTDQGDQLCFSQGQIASGEAFPVPSGFNSTNIQYISGPCSAQHAGFGWDYIQQCGLAPSTLVGDLVYNDDNGNVWGGNLNVFSLFYLTSGGVTTQSVTGGTAVVIPAASSSELTVVFATLINGTSFGLPTGVTFAVSSLPSMTSFISGSGSNVVHGYSVNTISGTTTNSVYQDASGNFWGGVASILAVGYSVPDLTIDIVSVVSNVGEFAITGPTGVPTAVSIGNEGTGYTVGDVLTLAGANGLTVSVTSVDGSGDITGISIASVGSGTVVASGLATSGGTGSGATVNVDTTSETLNPGQSITFSVICTAAYRGLIVYPQAVTVNPQAALAPTNIQLSYTGFIVSSAFTLTGATQGVLFSLGGTWGGTFSTFLVQSKSSLACEAEASWVKQHDFNVDADFVYLNRFGLRLEPLGEVLSTLTDTVLSSEQVIVRKDTKTFSAPPQGVRNLRWQWFDLENTGEVHLLKFTVPANSGLMSITMFAVKFEQQGEVYEGS